MVIGKVVWECEVMLVLITGRRCGATTDTSAEVAAMTGPLEHTPCPPNNVRDVVFGAADRYATINVTTSLETVKVLCGPP